MTSMSVFGKGIIRTAKNYTKGYSAVQVKVREATCNDPWGPSSTQMNEIAEMTYTQAGFVEVMEILDKRMNDTGKNWRHVFKSLVVINYLLHAGAENFIIYFKDNLYVIQILREFEYIDEYGMDRGANIRQKAKDICKLLGDEPRLRQERRARANMRAATRGEHVDGQDENYQGSAYIGHQSGGDLDKSDNVFARTTEKSERASEVEQTRQTRIRAQEEEYVAQASRLRLLEEVKTRVSQQADHDHDVQRAAEKDENPLDIRARKSSIGPEEIRDVSRAIKMSLILDEEKTRTQQVDDTSRSTVTLFNAETLLHPTPSRATEIRQSTNPFVDAEKVARCVRSALDIRAASSELLALRQGEAQTALDMMWQMLDMSHLRHFHNDLRRFTLKLAVVSNRLPAGFLLIGVQCSNVLTSDPGGFADVFCGTLGPTKVAVKRLRTRMIPSEDEIISLTKEICRESLLWKNLIHPHILPFIGISNDVFPNTICMVMPWMKNGNVRQFMSAARRDGRLRAESYEQMVNEWLRQVGLGIEYLHLEGLVHSDLHGGNLLLTDDLEIQLADFGMATIADASAYGYGSLHGGGKMRWTAPELFEPEQFGLDSRRPTFESDMYAYSCICIELYSGAAPFSEQSNLSDYTVMRKVVAGSRPQRPKIPSGKLMSDAMWGIVQLCWAHNPSSRPSASVIAQRLHSALQLQPPGSNSPIHIPTTSYSAPVVPVLGQSGDRITSHERSPGLSNEITDNDAVLYLRDWLYQNNNHPDLSEEEAQRLSDTLKVSTTRIRRWLSNEHYRLTMSRQKPFDSMAFSASSPASLDEGLPYASPNERLPNSDYNLSASGSPLAGTFSMSFDMSASFPT
ncbi:hypothetical protein EIP91_002972 [Steccherinum ochraceum]|uniref:Protein kinase domain-containing protein n=1 Tax=Steccherinum ochraceum TaxID=92696 RepID=A0A4R0RHJ4_9APHY|nr:hypothetical protein EIP91_002972 [Steccherinum ochraceum]